MINIDFYIDDKNNLRRTDTNPIISSSSNYLCTFTFEGEQWENIDKYVIFKTSKNKSYTASLGTDMFSTSSIPSKILSECLMKVSVYGGDLITTNEVSVLIIPTGYTPDSSSDESEFHDAFAEAYKALDDFKELFNEVYASIENKFDDVQLTNDNIIIFYSRNNPIATLDINSLLTVSLNWNNIRDKPEIINNGLFYKDNYILQLYDNNTLKQEISLQHTHLSEDVIDLETDIDIDLEHLLTNLTEYIRSL